MRIIVRATEDQRQEWLSKPASQNTEVIFTGCTTVEFNKIEGDIFFDLMIDETKNVFIRTDKPVFINAVTHTLNELPPNCIRINAWEGFLKRKIIEIAAGEDNKKITAEVMNALNWKYQLVPDIPGMIAPRIISMIINEAYFALQDDVSTKEGIDIAMQLGTNYPYGPFEWSRKIGLHKVYHLLKKLSETDRRYVVAGSLEEEIIRKWV